MEIIITADYDALSKKAAQIIAQVVKAKPTAVLGLATSNTPIGCYKELIRMHKEEGLDFSQVSTFNLDEYYGLAMDTSLSSEQDQSYKRFMFERLFNHINIKKENTHFLDGAIAQDQIAAHCKAFEEKIKELGGVDLQLLGIGVDGHIGFNEPGSALDSRTRLVPLNQQTINDNFESFFKQAGFSKDKVPTTSLTMGVATIVESKKILLIANGLKKAKIIAAALEGPMTNEVVASALQQIGDKVTVVLDKEAGSFLKNI